MPRLRAVERGASQRAAPAERRRPRPRVAPSTGDRGGAVVSVRMSAGAGGPTAAPVRALRSEARGAAPLARVGTSRGKRPAAPRRRRSVAGERALPPRARTLRVLPSRRLRAARPTASPLVARPPRVRAGGACAGLREGGAAAGGEDSRGAGRRAPALAGRCGWAASGAVGCGGATRRRGAPPVVRWAQAAARRRLRGGDVADARARGPLRARLARV